MLYYGESGQTDHQNSLSGQSLKCFIVLQTLILLTINQFFKHIYERNQFLSQNK